jgi:hypothetical protein
MQVEPGSHPGSTLRLVGLSDSAFSVPLANQPRFMKKRIATTTIAANIATSTMFANVMVPPP